MDNSTPKQFLKNIQYNIWIGNLIKIKKTCAYHENITYAPVLVEVVDPEIKTLLGCNYIIQVYNESGESVYEKKLKYDIQAWNIFEKYLVFKPHVLEEKEQFIHIVHLEKGCATIRVKDFMNDQSFTFLGISQELFYYANRNTIKLIDIKKDVQNGQTLDLDPKEDEIGTYEIELPNRLHGFFENSYSKNDTYIMCIIETDDNQIDYARLYNWNRGTTNAEHNFYQFREVVPRDIRNDPIKAYTQVIKSNEYLFALALRESGFVDFYWNSTLISTSDQRFDDVNSNFNYLFMKDAQTNTMYQVDLIHDTRIGQNVADSYIFDQAYWERRHYQLIKNKVKLFTSFTVAHCSMFVAYLNIITIFDIPQKKFVKNIYFDQTIVDLYRTKQPGKKDLDYLCVLLKNGQIKPLIQSFDQQTGDDQWDLSEEGGDLKIDGKIKGQVSDFRDQACHYFLIEKNGQSKVFGFKELKLVHFESIVLEKDQTLARYISKDDAEDFALINQTASKITTYRIPKYNDYFYTSWNQEFEITDNWKIRGTIHTIAQSEDGENLFMFTERHVYVYEKKSKTIINEKENVNFSNLQVIDHIYIYGLMNQTTESKSANGFYFQNLNTLLNKQLESQFFKMKNALVGQMNRLEYYKFEERMAFMTDYESIKIIPVLHRNTINFFGIKEKEAYVCFAKFQDKLVGFGWDNVLYSFSITTGKLLSRFKLKQEIVSDDWKIWVGDNGDKTYTNGQYYPKCLLFNKEATQFDDQEFYGDMLKCDLANSTAYAGILQHTYHKFRLIEIISDTEVKVHYEFVHPHIETETYQRMYISDDNEYMIERLLNQRVFFYKKAPTNDGLYKWDLIYRIKQYPKDLAEFSTFNYLFSPNLQFYLDFDSNDECFLIKRTVGQTVYKQIPKGLLNTKDFYLIARKFMWVDNSKIRIVNNEGLEKVFDVHQDLQQLSYGHVPMLDITDFFNNSENYNGEAITKQGHYFFDQEQTAVSNTSRRMRLKYQDYFRAYFLDNKRTADSLYDVLFKVDFTQKIPIADLSFTYFHWKLAELMADSKKKVKIKRFNPAEIKLLLLNIFPKGNTVLHMCTKNLQAIRKFYEVVEVENESGQRFEVPFINNFEGKTPLHMCLQMENYKSADLILNNLKSSPMDSHIRGFLDILPDLIDNDLPSMKEYLDSRFMQTEQIKAMRRGAINYKATHEDYSVDSCMLWPNRLDVEDKLFTKDKIETEIKLEFLDIPQIHSYSNKLGHQFFKALSDCKNMEMFECRSIQSIIDYKWPLCREYTIKLLFIPFIFYGLLWVVYSNSFNGQTDESEFKIMVTTRVIQALLYLFSIYFLVNESRQLINQGIQYLLSVWNLVDILPPILIITVISLNLSVYYKEQAEEAYDPNNFIYTIHSVASLLMWVKLLYFLRIFEETGYLIRMLSVVVWDMKIFLIILFIIYFAFGEAFLRLSEASEAHAGEDVEESPAFIKNYADAWVYAYRLSLGDSDTENFFNTIQPTTLWILWVICFILTNIVMLNMLIALIGESYGQVMEMKKQANYQERASMIAENEFLIPLRRKKELQDDNNYLIVATEVAGEEDGDGTKIEDQFSSIQEKLTKFKEEVDEKNKSLEEKIDRLVEKFKK